ncbi:MAG: NAD(P)H-dependent glycerol-3-phosphate dehydrogenase [Caldithrix sp.]|nr:NAD(P)H-dependent glycerol-3-phosphate dehydrogenase [Caldithrix sp.]
MRIAIIGAGSWGTALAKVLNDNKHEVVCYTIEDEVIQTVTENKENTRYLPQIKLSPSIRFTMNLKEALNGTELILIAVPSQIIRNVIPQITDNTSVNEKLFVTVAKGIENNTYKRASQIIQEVGKISPEQIVALSGPSHAEEVAREIPTAVVAASVSLSTAKTVQNVFMNHYFRVYGSQDIRGVELGGALKNIIALAAGICDGAGLGDNSKAALMTRGLVEMSRLGVAMEADSATFAGLSGMGDLIVTCMSKHSRNRYVGEQIGKGRKLQEILDEMVMVAEGVKTTLSAFELSKKMYVEMPITEQIYLTLFKEKAPLEALNDLMTRASKIEDWGDE